MKKITLLAAAMLCGALTAAAQNTENGHEYVDLGLPSGTLWATCNVGATAPEAYGNYYAWGETETKTNYTWSNYKFTTDGGTTFTKYNATDGKIILDPEDDAAAVNWGGKWRMPTQAKWTELRENCTWTWTSLNGTNGYEVKGKNGNSIFLPMAGINDNGLDAVDEFGFYWTSARHDTEIYANDIEMDGGSESRGYSYRYYGMPVRPVCDYGNTTGTTSGHEYVDLGLPSGTKWATCNLYAKTPEAYGQVVYQWAFTKYNQPHETESGSTTYTYTKYNETDGLTRLELIDDYAKIRWQSPWRMPTKADWEELLQYCTAIWQEGNPGTDSAGYILTSKINGESIFLPAAGEHGTGRGRQVSYWSSSLFENDDNCTMAWKLTGSATSLRMMPALRWRMMPLRPVFTSDTIRTLTTEITKFPASGDTIEQSSIEFTIAELANLDENNYTVSVDFYNADGSAITEKNFKPNTEYRIQLHIFINGGLYGDDYTEHVIPTYTEVDEQESEFTRPDFSRMTLTINGEAPSEIKHGPFNPDIYIYTEFKTFRSNQLTAPEFSYTNPDFTDSCELALTCSNAQANIYYTTDGTEPTTGSTLYTAPLTLFATGSDLTVKAIAQKLGLKSSKVASSTYKTYLSVAISATENADGTQTVTLGTKVPTSAPVEIRYTTDGTETAAGSTLYTEPFALYETATIRARVYGVDNISDSDNSAEITVVPPTALSTVQIDGLYVEDGRIVCAQEFRVFDLLGRDVTSQNGTLHGVYVVKTADAAQKVVVK